ncbi:AfsR/SARP family transcriptional regulator [Lentzea sp. NPDC051213]|uniref:AfsR/SARP family transcriptional regulator n=1 Tax=Lentzea sp. NPDC051213 TaxID=3364126 RepID=UPI00379E4575
MNVEFCLLGPFEVLQSGQPVRLGGARQRKLLAILLLNANRAVPADQLIDALWHHPPSSVRQQIHNSVGGLRRTLADLACDARVTRTDTGYRLDIAEELTDLHHFHEGSRAAREAEALGDLPEAIKLLSSALSAWRGEALSGLDGLAIETAAAKLNESRLTALELLAAYRMREQEYGAIIAELTPLVRQHPLRESLRATLMRALHLSGRSADALAVYEEGRNALVNELGLDPGTELRDLQLGILKGTVTVARPETPKPKSSPPDRRLSRFYLPHDTNDFSGRSAELNELAEKVLRTEPTTLVISAIDGMGGVGKTTLAVHFAHQVAEQYPDGQYFVDLHGFSAGVEPLSAEQALEQLLRDSGVPPELIPSGAQARGALWRSQLAGTRSLVLIDNVVDAAQVRPLLPGSAGVLVVVTSRRRLTALDGTVPVSLDVLPPDEAASMFAGVIGERRANQEPEAVAEAVRLCGYLPLAIRIAAARLRDRSSWTVADLVGRIRGHAHRARFLQIEDRNVMAVLKLSHRYLPALQSKVFRLLSLHPGTEYDAWSTAALAGITVEQAESCLDELFDFNLLKQNSPGQYHFHDLVRDCAIQLVNETDSAQERRAASHRLLDYYLAATEEWCRALSTASSQRRFSDNLPPQEVRPATSSTDATAVLGLEFPNLTAAARFAADNGWHGHAWRLVCAMEPYLTLNNYGGQSYELYAAAAEAANRDGDSFGESLCWSGLAAVCRERGHKEESILHIGTALELARRAGDYQRESALLIHLGLMYLDQDDYVAAEEHFRAAQALIAQDDKHPNHSTITNNLAVVFRELGRFDESLEHLNRSLELMPPKHVVGRLVTMCNIGMVQHAQRRHEEAARTLDEVLSGCEAIDYQPGIALAHVALCNVHRALGNPTTSVEHGRSALTLARQLRMHRVECEALSSLAEAALAAEDVNHAEKVYAQALERSTHFSFARFEARALEGLAHAARRRGDIAEATARWRDALDRYPRDMHDATHAQQHLASIEDESATCFRCE